MLLVAVAALAATPLSGQARRPMTLVDLAELPRVLDPQIAPDGRTITFMRSRPDWKLGRAVWSLWRQDVDGGAPKQLTSGGNGEIPGSTRWSPDGRTIAFVRDGQLQRIPADGGDVRPLTKHATPVTSPSWSPDGAAIYFLAADSRTPDERDRDRRRGDVYALDEGGKARQLWKVTVATGAEQVVTSGDLSVISYRLSRDGRRIALERAPGSLLDDAERAEVWVMDADGKNAHAVTSNHIEETDPELSPDGTEVLFLADASASLEPFYTTTIFTVRASGGVPRAVTTLPYAFDRATWSTDGRSIIASGNMGVHAEVFRIDRATGRAQPLTNGDHAVPPAPAASWSFDPVGGRLVFQLDEATRFGDVWLLDAFDGTHQARRVTDAFEAMNRAFALPRQEKIEWKSRDGTVVEGLLFYPLDYQAGRRYPLIVQLHGGPAESDKFGAGSGLVQNYFPVLAADGYAVLRPNYRGSQGYGSPFLRGIINDYFGRMVDDVMTGIDAVVARGVADPNRLALMGWSAGGHLVNKLVTVTNRFKAASSGAGAADWISLYAQTDLRTNRALVFGGTPWQSNAPIEALWGSSPVKDAANVKTPTLFFVGENDPRVPLAQSIEMFRAVQSAGAPTHLYVAPREGHQWGDLRHLIFKANAELEWFDRYVQGRAHAWQNPPE